MTYKTILLHVAPDAQLAKRVELAARLACHKGAHLVALATGAGPGLAAARGQSETLLRAIGTPSWEWRSAEGDACLALPQHALCADLLVAGDAANCEFNVYVALNAACPLLLVPDEGRIFSFGDRILLAWNGSPAAARSVRDALPLLHEARQVDLAVIDAPDGALPAAQESIADLLGFLQRHGIEARVREYAAADAGSGLLELAADLTSDLLVMGCRAHLRTSRWQPGGATRSVMEACGLPILMSH